MAGGLALNQEAEVRPLPSELQRSALAGRGWSVRTGKFRRMGVLPVAVGVSITTQLVVEAALIRR